VSVPADMVRGAMCLSSDRRALRAVVSHDSVRTGSGADGKRPLARPSRRQEDNIKMYHKYYMKGRSGVIRRVLVNMVMNFLDA
jgi:hypothetical protein